MNVAAASFLLYFPLIQRSYVMLEIGRFQHFYLFIIEVTFFFSRLKDFEITADEILPEDGTRTEFLNILR